MAGFLVAGASYRVGLELLDAFRVLAGGGSVRQAAQIILGFPGTPGDRPVNASFELPDAAVTAKPIDLAGGKANHQLASGEATITVNVDSADSTNPCDGGTFAGEFTLIFDSDDVTVTGGSFVVPADVFQLVLTGEFSICLDVTATADVEITIQWIDCVFGPLPDPSGGCTSDFDCAFGETCVAGGCESTTTDECAVDSDCADGQRCDGGACVDDSAVGCSTDADCGTGETCENGLCTSTPTTTCSVDADCSNGEVCEAGECVTAPVTGCTTDADCNAGETCENGLCTSTPTTTCSSDADCADGEVCQNGECVSAPAPECSTDADCGADETCESGACVSAPPVGFTRATILHRGAEHLVAGPELDAADGAVTPAGYSVTQVALSGDGGKVWFVLYDDYPNVEGDPIFQLWSVNTDGTGGSRSDVDPSHYPSGFGVGTNLDGSVAVTDSGHGSSVFATATPGNATQLLIDGAPCARRTFRVTDDGTKVLYPSFCSGEVYVIDLTSVNPVASPIAASDSFGRDTYLARGLEIGEVDISSTASIWTVAPDIVDDSSNLLPLVPVGSGFTSGAITNQSLPRDDVTAASYNLTDDGTTIGYCQGTSLDGTILGSCFVQPVGSSDREEITDPQGLTEVRRLVLSDDGSRGYVQTTDATAFGFFYEVGSGDRLVAGTTTFSLAPVFLGAGLSDDGTVLAAPNGSNVYVLHSGSDGASGFPAIVDLLYAFDDASDSLIVRAETTGASRVDLMPLYRGLEASRGTVEEQNPFYTERAAGNDFTEVEPGVFEYTIMLDGKRDFLSSDYRLRVFAVSTSEARTVFQDFSPVP